MISGLVVGLRFANPTYPERNQIVGRISKA